MKLSLNLASRRYLNQRALKWGFLLVTILLLLLIGLQLRIYFYSKVRMDQYRNDIADIQQQLGGRLPTQMSAIDVEEQKAAHAYAETILARDAFRWTALFDRLESYVPDNVSIRSFNPNYAKESLTLSGVCKEVTDLRMFLDTLHAASFEQVYLKNQNWTKVKDYQEIDRPALSFSIELKGVF